MIVRMDVFPSTVAIAPPDHETDVYDLTSAPATQGTIKMNTTRVVVSNDQVIIARDGQYGPTIVFQEKIDPLLTHKSSDRAKDNHVVTLSGQKIAFKKDSACGCGSRLKSWNPYGSIVSSINNPTE